MSESKSRVYDQYASRPEYEGLPRTYGGFAIIPGIIEDRPAVCIKQRNGKGSSPYLFDLPGGVMEKTDPYILTTIIREGEEEVSVDCQVIAAIGEPLHFLVKKDNVPVRVDSALAFLVQTQDTPMPGEEALVVAFVHERSFAGFKVVGRNADPANLFFGRTPIMIFDGLSVLHKPFYQGPLTDSIRDCLIMDGSANFLLVDGGNYLGRLSLSVGPQESQGPWQISLYHRLNPDQPEGYFHGALDGLIGS